MKPIIEIKNLSAGYDGRTVLHDVNLSIYERDFLGITATAVRATPDIAYATGTNIAFGMAQRGLTAKWPLLKPSTAVKMTSLRFVLNPRISLTSQLPLVSCFTLPAWK